MHSPKMGSNQKLMEIQHLNTALKIWFLCSFCSTKGLPCHWNSAPISSYKNIASLSTTVQIFLLYSWWNLSTECVQVLGRGIEDPPVGKISHWIQQYPFQNYLPHSYAVVLIVRSWQFYFLLVRPSLSCWLGKMGAAGLVIAGGCW